MEKQHPTEMADALGITSTTVTSTTLDEAYLDSLFSADPDQVTEINEPTATAPQPTAAAGPKTAPKQQQGQPTTTKPEERPTSFIVDDPDFIGELAAGSEDAEKTVVATTHDKKRASENTATQQIDTTPGEGETTKPQEDSTSNDHLTDFTRDLFQIGVLTADDGEDPNDVTITAPEALIERLNHEKKKGAVQILENILSQFGPEYREAFNAIYIDGVHPRDYFTQAENVEALAELDLSKVENQKYTLTRYYRSLGWDQAKINAKIEKLENYQDLEEEARDMHGTLLAKEQQTLTDTKERKKEELARRAATEQEYQSTVQRILKEKMKNREMDGIPLDEKTTRELAGYLLQKKWQLGDQQISDFEKDVLDLARPEHRELQIKIALLMHILKSDPTLSRLGRKAITTQTNNMFSFLQREQSTAKKQDKKVTNFFDD
jgi:hypothetical protein